MAKIVRIIMKFLQQTTDNNQPNAQSQSNERNTNIDRQQAVNKIWPSREQSRQWAMFLSGLWKVADLDQWLTWTDTKQWWADGNEHDTYTYTLQQFRKYRHYFHHGKFVYLHTTTIHTAPSLSYLPSSI